MNAIRIENLRSLADTGRVDLKPITLLLGENSSGKSTFLRTFPLLRQSMEARTEGPLLWFGDYVDFGDFQTALNKFAEREDITFNFSFPLTKPLRRRLSDPFSNLNVSDDLDITLTLKMTHDKKNQTQITSCHIDLADHKIIMELGDSHSITYLAVNARSFSVASQFRGIPRIGILPYLTHKEIDSKSAARQNYQDKILDLMVKEARRNVHQNTSNSTLRELVLNIQLGSSARMLNEIKYSEYSTETWKRNSSDWDIHHSEFKHLRDLVIAYHIPDIFWFCDSYLHRFTLNVKYIAPLRATAERFYRFQNLAVNEVDSQGQNLVMFLNNLTGKQRKNFSAWTEKFFNFTLHPQQQGAHISLQLSQQGSNHKFNLADMGFGFSQILPVLTQLWILSSSNRLPLIRQMFPTTFVIEQPELHLHPRLQALLADAFLGAVQAAKEIDIDLRLIIETHSEAMVNRFGQRIAHEDMDPQDINVVIFEKERVDGPSQVRFSGYDPEGFLTNWPYGFFEAEAI